MANSDSQITEVLVEFGLTEVEAVVYQASLALGSRPASVIAQKAKLKTLIFTATHKLVDKAKVIVAEDLTSPIQSKRNYGKNTNRRLNTWAKGLLANALTSISHRRGSTVHLVNSAYTSQSDSFLHGLLIGTRKGDRFHRFNGEVRRGSL